MRRILLGVSVALLLGGYVWIFARVRSMESAEADVWGVPQHLGDLRVIAHHQLLTVGVREGQSVVLEVCSQDGFASSAWEAVDFEVWFLPSDERVVAKSMGELRGAVWREAEGVGCVVVTRRVQFGIEGELGLGVAWDALPEAIEDVELQGHGIVWEPIDAATKFVLGVLLFAALGLVVGWSWPAPRDAFAEVLAETSGPTIDARPPAWRVLAWGLAALGFALGGWPSYGEGR